MSPIVDLGPKVPAPTPAKILIVDDEEVAAERALRILAATGYSCTIAIDAESARRKMALHNFPLVLTDLHMPGDDGLSLVAQLRSEYPDVATIVVSARGSTDIAEAAVDAGSYAYLTKPIIRDELLASVSSAIRRRELEVRSRCDREMLQERLEDRTRALWDTNLHLVRAEARVRSYREETIRRLVIAAETRDHETACHVERMSRYSGLLAEQVLQDAAAADDLRLASVLHDVGKLGIPENILMKPGQLTENEYEVMKTHTDIGHRILEGSGDDLLDLAATIAWTHHERFDGSGYPRQLSGTDIPLSGRVAAVADVFDALTTNRVYRAAFDLPKTLSIMRNGRGTHFDPDLLDAFLDLLPEVLSIKEANPDQPGRSKQARIDAEPQHLCVFRGLTA